jgi:5-methylcytosine-specific restriction enzyme A
VLVRDGSQRCDAHKRPKWTKTAAYKRESGRALQRKRAALFAREPLCRTCSGKGLVTPATIRDHIKPLAEGGTDTPDNEQPLCDDCHREKTLAEALRGRGGANV